MADTVAVMSWDRLDASQRTAAMALLDDEVGTYYRAERHAHEARFAAVQGGEVVGAAIGTALAAEDRAHILQEVQRKGPPAEGSEGDRIVRALQEGVAAGDLFALAVAPFARRQGIARLLTESRLEAFRSSGYALAVAESWIKSTGDSSEPLYDALGFIRVARIQEYWLDQDRSAQRADPRGCPICGFPCRCGAVIFATWLTAAG